MGREEGGEGDNWAEMQWATLHFMSQIYSVSAKVKYSMADGARVGTWGFGNIRLGIHSFPAFYSLTQMEYHLPTYMALLEG